MIDAAGRVFCDLLPWEVEMVTGSLPLMSWSYNLGVQAVYLLTFPIDASRFGPIARLHHLSFESMD